MPILSLAGAGRRSRRGESRSLQGPSGQVEATNIHLSSEEIIPYATELGSQQSSDFLLGFGIVGDASAEELKNATMIAWRRTMTFVRIMRYLRGPSDQVERIAMNEFDHSPANHP
jgi:hypothetical protein